MPDEDRIAGILEEFLERRDRGEDPSPDEFVEAHPEVAEELRSHFEILGLYDREFSGPDLPPGVPRQVGDFTVLREIGRGGMAVVYEAEQVSMGRKVALKLLSPHITSARQAVTRFRREAQAAGQLHHTNIVPVHAMGEDRGLWYYAMELVEGPALSEVVDAMRPPVEGEAHSKGAIDAGETLGTTSQDRGQFRRIAEMMAGVAEALQTAHDAGIIHRDVKPANLMLHADGTLKLVDFGLARLSSEGGSMTVTGQLIGTPFYMSPEQAMAKRVRIDARTDVYSLGATIYELLALEPPFRGDSLQEVCSQIISKDPPLMRRVNPRIPKDLETIVLKAMEKDRARRYQSAGELAKDLRRFAEGMPIRARRVGPVERAWRKVKRHRIRAALVAAVVLLAAVGAFFALRSARKEGQRDELEYAMLCARAEEAIPRSRRDMRHLLAVDLHAPQTAEEFYSEAIALLPDHPEAYLGRALQGGSVERRLADLDAAQVRGLPARTWRLARAFIYRREGDLQRCKEEKLRAGPRREGSAADAYLAAQLIDDDADPATALELLSRVIEKTGRRSTWHYLALRRRADLRTRAKDFSGALEDLAVVQDMGDESVDVVVRVALVWRRMGQEEAAGKAFREALARAAARGELRAWRFLCDLLRKHGEVDWHATVTEEAIRTHGYSRPFLADRVFSLFWGGKGDDAIGVLRQAVEDDPIDHEAHELLGLVLDRAHRFEQAAAAYERANELSADCPKSRLLLGVILSSALGRHSEGLARLDEAAELDPSSALIHLNRGMVLERMRRPEDAIEAYRRAIALRPARPLAHKRHWNLLHRLGREDEARATMERVAAADRESPAWERLCAVALQRLGKTEEALDLLEAAIRRYPAAVNLYVDRAGILRGLGRCPEALAECDEVIKRRPRHDMAHEMRGNVLLDLNQLEDALSAFERAADLNPHCSGARFGRGNALRRLGRTEEALAAFEACLRIEPRHARALTNKGVMLDRLDRPEEALVAYDLAIEIEPTLPEAHICRGALLQDRFRRSEEALEEFNLVLETDDTCLEAWVNRGVVLCALGRCGEAADSLARACELRPKSCRFRLMLAEQLNSVGRFEEAAEVLREATRLEPENPRAWTLLGISLDCSGQGEEAISAFTRALAIKPEAYRARQGRGVTYFNLGKLEDALEDFQRAVEIRPKAAASRLWLADTLRKLERYEKAILRYDEFLRLSPDDHRGHNNRGIALFERGRFEEAAEAFGKVLEIHPDAGWAHHSRGCALRQLCRFGEALDEQDAYLKAHPDDGRAEAERGFLLASLGRFEEVPEVFARALELLPDATEVHVSRHRALLLMGEYPRALESADKLVSIDPRRFAHHRVRCLRAAGRTEEARTTAIEATKARPAPEWNPLSLAYLYAVAGLSDQARSCLEAFDRPWGPFDLYTGARVHAVLGTVGTAIEWLGRAAKRGFRRPSNAKPDPDFASLEQDPRYRALLEKMRGK